MALCWPHNGSDQTKICPAGAPGRTVDKKMFCGNSGIKSEERELFEPPNPAACDDKHHVYERHDRHRQDNDDK
ncbi:MAG TPA: hypothetical protein PLY04_18080 [bacterium]|nr:hypothetical protein [bacterium]